MADPSTSWRTWWLTPPSHGADRGERLRFIRDLSVRATWISVLLLVVAVLVGADALIAALVAIGLAAQLVNIAWLTLKLRRQPVQPRAER